VSVDGKVVLPKNGYLDNNGRFRLKLLENEKKFFPEPKDKVNGENFISRADSTILWVVCGNSTVKVTQAEVLIVSFTLPAMTNEEFFGEKIVENLAAFLNMDPKKVRIVNIVMDTSTSERLKRAKG
ncbi:unnamed protein product, partial [Lymnaea stagnalis]